MIFDEASARKHYWNMMANGWWANGFDVGITKWSMGWVILDKNHCGADRTIMYGGPFESLNDAIALRLEILDRHVEVLGQRKELGEFLARAGLAKLKRLILDENGFCDLSIFQDAMQNRVKITGLRIWDRIRLLSALNLPWRLAL